MNKRIRPAFQQWMLHAPILVLLIVLSLASCNGSTGKNSPPEAPVTTPKGPEIQAVPGKELTVQASATGAERYEWKLEGPGKISTPTGPVIDYSPPLGKGERATLMVTAYNAHGASSPTQLSIRLVEMVPVRLDALAIPAGWMSGGGTPTQLISLSTSQTGCREGPGCTRITYRPGGQWGGIFWWPLSCGDSGTDAAWEKVKSGACGIDIPQASNLKEVHRLTFWVRGERGGEGIEFKVGAVDIPPSPGRSTGKTLLKNTWEQKEIDLKGMNLTKAVGLYGWVATDVANPQGATFYLDGIQFEGVR